MKMKNNVINATQTVAAGETPAMFSNPEFGSVRIIVKENGSPLFCLRDICDILEVGKTSEVKERLDEDTVVTIAGINPKNPEQGVTFVNESGLYDVILDSRKPNARAFRKWVTNEVLPSIRKTGSYSVTQQQQPSYQIEDSIERAKAWIKEEEQRRLLTVENQKLTTKIEEDAPKVECWDQFVGESNELISITDFAKVLHNKWSDITPHRLFAILREAKILQDGYFNKNIPYQHYIKEGYFKVKEKPSVNKAGLNFISRQTLVTPKGQKYLIGKFLSARASDEENDIDMFE